MKRTLFTLITCFLTLLAFGQSVNKIGDINIQPIEHATFVINWNGKNILFDPSTDKKNLASVRAPDLVFITDIHGDHFNVSSMENLDLSKATLVVPKAVAEQLPEKYRRQVHILKNGDSTVLDGVKIEAIPMYNLPESADAFHPKGRGNGYVLTLGEKRVYISGDTEDTPDIRALKDISIAFVCMNLPYTMTVKQAAEAVLAFKPKIVYPYHYRGQHGESDVNAFKELVNGQNKSIEVVLEDWYPAD